MSEARTYLTDDCDEERVELRLLHAHSGNGDWYVSVLPEGHKIGPTVRVTTSGARRGQERVAAALAGLWRALGGEADDRSAEAETAARGLVMGHYLYGIPKPRGWSGCVFDALKVLHPAAAEHLAEHQNPGLTLDTFWPDEHSPRGS